MDAPATLKALYPMIEVAGRSESAMEAATAALDALESALGFRRAWIQHQDSAGECRVVLARGLPEGFLVPGQPGLQRGRGEIEVVVRPTAPAPEGTLLASLRPLGVAAATLVPMVWRGAGIGALVILDAGERPLAGEERRLACAIASLTGIVCGRARAIVSRRRLEKELIRSQQLENVGRVAGGIAHDFNNMLTAMIGYMDLAAAGLPADAEEQGYLSQALEAADMATVLTRQMLAFARRQPVPPAPQDLSGVLGRMAPLVRRLLPETVEVNFDATTPGCWIVADPGQVEQAIVNLTFRARDAMVGGGGVLTLATHLIEGPDGEPRVALDASDTGRVVDEESLLNASEPFRGPHDDGSSDGLALAIVAALVRDSGGRLEAESDAHNGTRVRAVWPLAAAAGASRAAGARRSGGAETVLFVEDDGPVRGLGIELLSRLGYNVLAARHADDAMQRLSEHAGEVHLLVADLVMPGMDGRELAQRAQALRPGLRVLLTSGYSSSADETEIEGGFAFMPKPFTGEILALRVREALDAPPR